MGSSNRALFLVKDRGTVTQRFGTLLSKRLLILEGSKSLLMPHWALFASFSATWRWKYLIVFLFTTHVTSFCTFVSNSDSMTCQSSPRWRCWMIFSVRKVLRFSLVAAVLVFGLCSCCFSGASEMRSLFSVGASARASPSAPSSASPPLDIWVSPCSSKCCNWAYSILNFGHRDLFLVTLLIH